MSETSNAPVAGEAHSPSRQELESLWRDVGEIAGHTQAPVPGTPYLEDRTGTITDAMLRECQDKINEIMRLRHASAPVIIIPNS